MRFAGARLSSFDDSRNSRVDDGRVAFLFKNIFFTQYVYSTDRFLCSRSMNDVEPKGETSGAVPGIWEWMLCEL